MHACDFTAYFSSDPYVELVGRVLLPDHSLVAKTVTKLRCVTSRIDCCSNDIDRVDTKWYLPSGDTATARYTHSTGLGYPLGSIALTDVSTVSGNQGIYRCTVPESDPAANPSTISFYVGIYNLGQGE